MPRWVNEEITWVADGRGVLRGVIKPREDIAHPGLCQGCHKQFDLAKVEVIARYADCSMWKCPHCDRLHDSRPKWGGAPGYRMGYIDLRLQERTG